MSPETRWPDARFVPVRSAAEAEQAIRRLYSRGAPIHFEGAGSRLAPFNQQGTFIVQNRIRDAIERVAENRLHVTTGWRWLDVLSFLDRHGLSFPVLTSNLNASVGGTLATGGVGLFSHRYGMQIDHVSGCVIHTALGTFDCQRSDDPLWRASLCSLGATGFVSSVMLEVRPAFEHFTISERSDPISEGLARFVDLAAEQEASHVLVACRLDRGSVTTRIGATSSNASRLNGNAGWQVSSAAIGTLARSSTPRSNEAAARLWNDYIVPVESAMPFLETAQSSVARASTVPGLRPRLRAIGMAAPQLLPSDPYLRPRAPRANRSVGVGFYIDLLSPDTVAQTAAERLHRELKRLCLELGGAPYAAGTLTLSDQECRMAFGADWLAYREVRRRHDPDGRFSTNPALPS